MEAFKGAIGLGSGPQQPFRPDPAKATVLFPPAVPDPRAQAAVDNRQR